MGVSRIAVLISVLACDSVLADGSLIWESTLNAVNRASTDALMDGGFRFQLGVFQGSFVPTTGNKDLWAQNWVAARHLPYLEPSKSYSDNFLGFSLPPHITEGKATYVWGFKGDPASSEWILFRNSLWNWPGFNIDPPPPLRWRARDATPILGQINSNGSPFLMKSAAVSNVAPPTVTWSQWAVTDLAGVSENGVTDDPDDDGTPNLLEFIFGTSPTTANAPTATPVSLVDGHLVITIPRRIDRPANLVVEVSGDMETWVSGPTQTEVLSSGLSSMVVRDLTLYNPLNPKRFMRLRVSP
jgi:hypothetical protein